MTGTGAAERWPLWGGEAFLAVADPNGLRAARMRADTILDAVDRTCSRFREDSDLTVANRHAGEWVEADPLLVAATRAALWAAEASNGLVDPCLGRPLASLGYDVDLAVLRRRPPLPAPVLHAARPGAWREVGVDEGAVRVPRGVHLDLGASAKAWAADLVATTLADELGCPVVVSLAGDLRVAGPGDSPAEWPVRVTERPDDVGGAVEVVVNGGLATSSTLVRRWRAGARECHHLLDPWTGRPVAGAYRTATAAGRTCLAANTASTASLVLGATAPGWLARRRVTARLVDVRGAVTTVGGWPSDPTTPAEEAA